MPKVSIITPTYNHEAYIGACIESVLAQTFTDWEMWIMDDGSTDRTKEIAESYSDPRIHVVTQKNQGLARLGATYNDALKRCTGYLIAILEGDDTWPADKLAIQVPDFEDKNVVLSCGTTLQSVNGEISPILLPNLSPAQLRNDPVTTATLAICTPTVLTFAWPVSTVYRKEALSRISGFWQPVYLPLVDLPTLLSISTIGKFAWHDEPLGIWRRHEASATGTRFSEILDGSRRLILEFLDARPGLLPTVEEQRIRAEWDAFTTHRFLLLARSFLKRGMRPEATRAVECAARTAKTRNQKLKISVARSVLALRLPWDATFGLVGIKEWNETTSGGDSFIRDSMLDGA